MEQPTEMLKRIEFKLFGEFGDTGVIGRLREADDKNEALIEQRHKENQASIANIEKKFDRVKWLIVGFIAACCFFTGSGTVSLDHIARVMGWLK